MKIGEHGDLTIAKIEIDSWFIWLMIEEFMQIK